MPPFNTSDTADSSVAVLYHAATRTTGPRLADYLGVDGYENASNLSDHDSIIRWGSRESITNRLYFDQTIQSREAIRNASQKYDALQTFQEHNIPAPDTVRSRNNVGRVDDDSTDLSYPVLARDDSHSQGTDIELILQGRDAYLISDADHYVDYIPVDLEYRMHVVDGEVIKVHEKRLRHEAEMSPPHIRNSGNGWVFLDPRDPEPAHDIAIDAVESLGLDYGAVDVIREEWTSDEYVLEVNSAPTLDEANLERYGDAFADMLDLDDVAGLSAVDFEEEDDDTDDE